MKWWTILVELFGKLVEKLLDKPIKEKKEYHDVKKNDDDDTAVWGDTDW